MTEQPRDWDKELADIDRVIDKERAARPAGAAPACLPGLRAPPARLRRRSTGQGLGAR